MNVARLCRVPRQVAGRSENAFLRVFAPRMPNSDLLMHDLGMLQGSSSYGRVWDLRWPCRHASKYSW
jgi:hypothetical protein